MNKINNYILILVIFTFFISTCTEPNINNPYDPEYELPAPSNLNTDQPTVNTCKITWKDNAEKEVGYKIERKTSQKQQMSSQKILQNNNNTVLNKLQDCKNDKQLLVNAKNLTKTNPVKPDSINTKSDWEIIATLEADEEEYTDTELNPYADYNYRVYAYVGENESEKKEKSINMQFRSPTDFDIEQTSLTSCKLNWNYEMSGIDGFRIDRKVNNSSWDINYANTISNIEEYEDTDVLPESTYNYRVYAFMNNYESNKKSGDLEIEIPAPNNLASQILDGDKIKLTWDYEIQGINGFIMERKINEENWQLIKDTLGYNTTEYLDTDLNYGETYYYRIQAFLEGYNPSSYSETVKVYFYLIPSEGLVAYYPFNGNANDESGNENDGTNHGATLCTDRFGDEDCAYEFDGYNNFLQLANLNLMQPVTISVWINIEDTTFSGPVYVSDHHDSYWAEYYGINMFVNSGRIHLSIGDGSYPGRSIKTNAILNENVWYHLSGEYYSDGSMSVHVNGNSISFTEHGNTNMTTLENLGEADEIGRDDYSRGRHYFEGSIDDIRIYERALNEQEIHALYHENGWGL